MFQKKPNEWLKDVLIYLDRTHGLGKLYYPGSGWHRVPLETLGGDRVYHVSANENKGSPDLDPEQYGEEYRPIFEQGYFGKLGDDALHKYEGDYRDTHFFEDDKFDSTLIWGIPVDSSIEAIPEFRRVTKKGGLFIVDNEFVYSSSGGEYDKISKILDNQLRRLTLPEELSIVPVYQNYEN